MYECVLYVRVCVVWDGAGRCTCREREGERQQTFFFFLSFLDGGFQLSDSSVLEHLHLIYIYIYAREGGSQDGVHFN